MIINHNCLTCLDPIQWYAVYDGIFSAMRMFLGIQRRYREAEIPAIQTWQRTLTWMLRVSYDLHRTDELSIQRYRRTARQTAHAAPRTELPTIVTAQMRTLDAANLTDRRGRKNTGRLAPLAWSSHLLLDRRVQAIRGIEHTMDERLAILSGHLDLIWRMIEKTDAVVTDFLASDPVLGPKRKRERQQMRARELVQLSLELRAIKIRPYGQHALPHVRQDLDAAADALFRNDAADAREILDRIARSIALLRLHQGIEEILLPLSSVVAHHVPVPARSCRALVDELYSILGDLQLGLDCGFARRLVSSVRRNLRQAIIALEDTHPPDLASARESLKRAAAHF